jgi:hypothetical protein
MRMHGGPSPVKAQQSKLRMLRCSWAASSALVRYSLRMLFSASDCSIFFSNQESAKRRNTGQVFRLIVVCETYVEDSKTAVRRFRLNAVCSKVVNSAAFG